MRKFKVILLGVVLCFLLSGCGMLGNRRTNYLGFEIGNFIIVKEEDTHGGWLGDGDYHLVLDCSKNPGEARNIVKDWKPLPLSENLDIIMYGGVRDNVVYRFQSAERAQWPRISNGVYLFMDRHDEAIDPADDTNLLNRYSYNFTVAMYDLDNDRLYYFELDT